MSKWLLTENLVLVLTDNTSDLAVDQDNTTVDGLIDSMFLHVWYMYMTNSVDSTGKTCGITLVLMTSFIVFSEEPATPAPVKREIVKKEKKVEPKRPKVKTCCLHMPKQRCRSPA